MAKYIVTDPRGIERTIEATSPDEAISIAKKQAYAQLSLPGNQEAVQSAAQQETENPLLIGAGRAFDTILAGAKQAALEGARATTSNEDKRARLRDELARLAEEQAANTQAYKAFTERFPVQTAIGESLPYGLMRGGPLGLGLQIGAIEGLKYGTPEERATRGVLGFGSGALAGAIGNTISKYVNPDLTTSQQEALSGANRLGIKPRLSQVTQSPTIARIEDAAARIPGGAGVFEDFQRANQVAANQAAARSMGTTADQTGQLGEKMLQATRDKFGRVFEAIKSVGKVKMGGREVNPILLDKGVEAAADKVLSTQTKLGSRADPAIVKLAQEAKRMAGLKARIDGESYQLWHSTLTDSSYSAYSGGDSVAGRAYQNLMKALDDSAVHSLRMSGLGSIADELVSTRPLYANFKLLTKGNTIKSGDVNISALARSLRKQNAADYLSGGGGELGDLARYSEAFPSLRPGSQTFERGFVTSPVTAAVAAAPAYAAARAATSPVLTTIPARLGGTPMGAILAPTLAGGAQSGIVGLWKRFFEPVTP